MKTITELDLKEVLRLHELWLEGEGVRAKLRGVNLRGANLNGVNLRNADLYKADLRGAKLRGANLSGADLSGVNLRNADLYKADLSGADLNGADLSGANLSNIRNLKIYSIDNVGTFNGKVTYLPSHDTVWAGCWSGSSEEFYEKCKEVQSEHFEDLNLRLAIYMVKETKKSYLMN